MAFINKQDTDGTKANLLKGEFGLDDHVAGGDAGAVYIGTTGADSGVRMAFKSEVDAKLGLSANAVSATKLATARTFDIIGDITATGVTFDGTADVTISAVVNDDSHNHIIGNVDGLQAALDGKQAAGTYNTIIGTDTNITTAGATIVNSITMTDGVIQSHNTRVLGISDIATSGTTIKTVGGVSLLGAGDVSTATPSIGFGQTVRNLTLGHNVTYTNTSGAPIFLTIRGAGVNNVYNVVSIVVDGVSFNGGSYTGNAWIAPFACAVVPNGSTYRPDFPFGISSSTIID